LFAIEAKARGQQQVRQVLAQARHNAA